jgi:hypothetical protein
MANKKISEFPTASTTYTGSEVALGLQSGNTVQIPIPNPALKANVASPTFTGVPAAPTASVGTNTTQLATTAFVTTADNLKIDASTLASSTGFFVTGAFVKNSVLSILGTSPNKYIISGWMRITTGSSHTAGTDWVECRTLTGT